MSPEEEAEEAEETTEAARRDGRTDGDGMLRLVVADSDGSGTALLLLLRIDDEAWGGGRAEEAAETA